MADIYSYVKSLTLHSKLSDDRPSKTLHIADCCNSTLEVELFMCAMCAKKLTTLQLLGQVFAFMTDVGLFCIMVLKCLSFDLDVYKCAMRTIHVACRNAYGALVGNIKGRDNFENRL
jgi:hypothetical protein